MEKNKNIIWEACQLPSFVIFLHVFINYVLYASSMLHFIGIVSEEEGPK